MADFEPIAVNTTAEKLEKIANMDVLTETVETENDNALVSATALLKTLVENVDLSNYYIKIWQPNTEYKKGDRCLAIVPTDIPYFCEYKLINCAVDHISSDSVEDDIEKVMWLLTFDGIGKSLSDAYGNVIHETYATKEELAEAIGQALEGDY